MLTFEVERLANWFEQIANNTHRKVRFYPTDPCLHFEILVNEVTIKTLRIYFELEVKPDWVLERGVNGNLWVEFSFHEINLLEAANHLRELLKKYPQRAFRDS